MRRCKSSPSAPERLQEPEMTLQNPKKIQVLNIPDTIPVPQMLDKLTIYFQKAKNGGGEVLYVEYPTSVNNCAYIIFQKEEDANNVLKREHVLQLDNKYKLEVREVEKGLSNADRKQVIQFVSTKLDTGCFPKGKAHQLIFRHDFEIIRSSGCIMEIKGSFSSLKKLRIDLMNLIQHPSPQEITNPGLLTNVRRHNKDESPSQAGAFRNYRQGKAFGSNSDSSTESEEGDYGTGQHASNIQSRSSVTRVHSGKSNSSPLHSDSSPSSLPVTSSNNLEATSPYTHKSARRLQETVRHRSTENDYGSLSAYSSHPSTSSSSPSLTFTVDILIFKYLMNFGPEEFHHHLERCSIQYKPVHPGDLYDLTLYPKGAAANCRERLSQAKTAICEHIEKIQPQLRIHQVDLSMKKHLKQDVLHRCNLVDWNAIRVLLRRDDQTITLVGPSSESFHLLQYILGKSTVPLPTGSSGPCQRGRRLNRTDKHSKRNSSCPPAGKENPSDDSNANHPVVKNINQTQAQTADQRKSLSGTPRTGCGNRKRRSFSESRKTNKQKVPNDFDIADSQTKAGGEFDSQRIQDDKQSKLPVIRPCLNPNAGKASHKSKKRGQSAIDV
ncbi:uncharacterized protein LOC144495637 isoform X2 [Mustelus asterias]